MEEESKLPNYLSALFESSSFQKAIDEIGEDRPHWKHPCSGCTFIGSYQIDLDKHQLFDLYVHGEEALSARWGPNIRDYVIAEIPEAEEHRFQEPTHPIIEALRRWKEKRNG